MIAPVMEIAVQNHGLVMALQIVKTRPGAVTSPVMIMMAATVMVVVLLVALMVEVQTVMTVYMTLPHMDPNAVILPGMNMVLIVPHWKVAITGIVPVVHALVTVTLYVVTDLVMVMKLGNPAQMIVMNLAHVIRVKL